MKIRRLIKYVKRYTNRDTARLVINHLNESDIRAVAEHDAIDIANHVLTDQCKNKDIVDAIMIRFMEHEVRRNRMNEFDMKVYMLRYGYGCWGCADYQPNQLAHMDPGGCLYNPENEFW